MQDNLLQGFPLHCRLGDALPPAGEGRHSKVVQIQPQDIGVGAVTEFPWTSLPEAM